MDPETAGSCWTWTSAVLPCCHLLKEEGAMMSANTHTYCAQTHLACFCLIFFFFPSIPPCPSYARKCDLFTSFKWLPGNIMSNEKSICLAPHTQTLQQKKKQHSFILLRHWQGHLLAELLRKENPKAKQKGKKWKDSCPVTFFFLSDTGVYFYLFDFSHD